MKVQFSRLGGISGRRPLRQGNTPPLREAFVDASMAQRGVQHDIESSKRGPDERSEIRGQHRRYPGCRFAHPGYRFG
jgi:hypothetical protein